MNESSNSSTKNSRCEENPNLRQKNTEANKWPYNKYENSRSSRENSHRWEENSNTRKKSKKSGLKIDHSRKNELTPKRLLGTGSTQVLLFGRRVLESLPNRITPPMAVLRDAAQISKVRSPITVSLSESPE